MPTGAQINQYISRVMSNPNLGDAERTRQIANKANRFGVDANTLAANSQLNMGQINRNLERTGLTLPGPGEQNPMEGLRGDQYGLRGAADAVVTGSQAGQDIISQTQGQVSDLYGQGQQQLAQTGQQVGQTFDQGIQGLNPFMQSGQQANDVQAALSGSLGPEAQQQAMAQYQSSPYVDQARENAERAIKRNASATGSVGSGNTLDQLYQNAAGMFMQDFGNQFQRQGQIADRGLSAGTTAAGLRGQQAGIQSNLGQAAAGMSGQEAGLQAGLGQYESTIPISAGSEVGGYRYQAGRDIADSVASTTSSLANLINQQGTGMSNMVGQYANNINSLYQQAAQGDAQAKEQLGVILSNLAGQQGSQYAGLPMIQPPQTNYLGQAGQFASGIGGMLSYYDQAQGGGGGGIAATGPNSLANTNPGYGPSYAGPYDPLANLSNV